MQFIFTESNYTGSLKFGGRLEFVAENAQEVESLISHFKLFPDVSKVDALKARIQALESGSYRHTIGTDKRPAYEVDSCLDSAFSVPYEKWMESNLGYSGPLPDLELSRKWGGLKHTNYQARIFTMGGHICFEAFTTARPWNGKDAQDYAESLVADYIGEEFGTRFHEPEMIQAGRSNMMKHNPNYLKRHRATPQASNTILKCALFEWWLANHANDAQRAIVAGNREIAGTVGSYMGAFDFERPESRIYYGRVIDENIKTQDYKSVTFSEFAVMGAKQ